MSKNDNTNSNKNNGEDLSSPKNTESKKGRNKKSSDSKDNSNKERRTLNISLQKRNLDNLNSIIDTWEEDGLVVSSEVCKSILFKNDFENNAYLQTFLSTFNLIKTSISNKDLFDKTYDEALTTALKNILNIKINAIELVNLLENDLYFKSIENNITSNGISLENRNDICNTQTNIQNNIQDNTQHYNSSIEERSLNINHKQHKENNHIDNITNNSTIESELATTNINNIYAKTEESKPLVWKVPEPIKNINNKVNNIENDDINKKFDAFNYNI